MFFGVNKQAFPQLSASGGVTSFRYYAGPTDGPHGVPTSFPGGKTKPPSRGYNLIYSFRPDVDMVISGALDKPLTAFFAEWDDGTIGTAWHEGNLKQHNISGNKFIKMHEHLFQLVQQFPGITWGPIYGAGGRAEGYVPGGMDFYGLDGYQRHVGQSAADVFEPNYNDVRAEEWQPDFAIIETNSFVGDHSVWFEEAFQYAVAANMIGFCPFYGGPGVPNSTSAIEWYDWDLPKLQSIARRACTA